MPFHDMRVYDSDTILNIQQIPDSMVIAGGGVIGCEYACMFSALGIQVNLIEGRGRLLGFMDQEVSATLAQSMRNMGIAVQLNDAIESVEARASLSVHLKSGTTIDAGALLAATGRSGNTERARPRPDRYRSRNAAAQWRSMVTTRQKFRIFTP